MKTSTDRILTTHVGSLPRSQAVADVVFGRDQGALDDQAAADQVIADAVDEIVRRQAEVGIDVVSDGEMSKISYATYIHERITGFGGDSYREPAQDLLDFPGVLRKREESGARSGARPPRCIAEIAVKDMQPLQTDLANLQRGLNHSSAVEAFMNAASPGVIALFLPNDYSPTHEAYVEALGEARVVSAEGLLADLDHTGEARLRVVRPSGVEVRVAQVLEFLAQRGEVVDLAVEDDMESSVGAGHRLMTRRREIDDR